MTDAVREAQLLQTRQLIDDDRQSQVVPRHRRLVEVNYRLILDLFFNVCTTKHTSDTTASTEQISGIFICSLISFLVLFRYVTV